MKNATRRWIVLLAIAAANSTIGFAQSVSPSPDRSWPFTAEREIREQAKALRIFRPAFDKTRSYSLAELVDFAERNNPETRVAWESAKASLAALRVAQSELYPALTGIALSLVDRQDLLFDSSFVRQTVAAFGPLFQLQYTVFDFGARAGRIAAARAELSAANFAFNDTHRRIIFEVADSYYRLLNATGQLGAAEASLLNAKTVQEAAEARLNHGLATLPDVLEAKAATAQAEYELQSTRGAEEIAYGRLATALGIAPTLNIRVQPLDELPAPDVDQESIDDLMNRALEQRPDLLQQLAEVNAAESRIREARAAYYPSMKFETVMGSLYQFGWQEDFPGARRVGLPTLAAVRIEWNIFDGGARKHNLLRAEEVRNAAAAQARVTMDQIADDVWRSYSNVKTAFRRRQAATAFLEASSQSFSAAVEAYGYGVRSLLDVTAAQRTLAQARSADIAARTEVLDTLAELAFQTGDLMRIVSSKGRP